MMIQIESSGEATVSNSNLRWLHVSALDSRRNRTQATSKWLWRPWRRPNPGHRAARRSLTSRRSPWRR